MNEDVKRVLKMVEEGTITADEAERLIRAMDTGEEDSLKDPIVGDKKAIRIKVVEKGDSKVNIRIPLSLVNIVTKIAPKFIPYDELPNGDELRDIDWDEIVDTIKDGVTGKIVDIQDGEDAVEIYVE